VFDELSFDDPPLSDPTTDPDPSIPGTGGSVVGGDESQHWQSQEVDGLCGPTSVAMVVSELSGELVEKDAVAQKAAETGLLTPEPDGRVGMTGVQVERLLELYGVPADVETGDLARLESHLAAGHGVILGVDASELAGYEDSVAQADHVLVVTGIDHVRDVATLNDPGRPDGAGLEIPLSTLVDSWADSGNQMIVAEVTPAQADEPGAGASEDGISAWVILPVLVGAGGAILAAVRAARRRREDEGGLGDVDLGEEPPSPPHSSRRSDQPPPSALSFGEGEID
jgi:hypothetical protein